MAWTTISNALVAVGALPFATTIQALRDNPIAIANGDAGAPRVVDAALSTSVTGDGASWVGARTAALGAGGVGTYCFGYTSADVAFGGTVAGSDLILASAARRVAISSSSATAAFVGVAGLSGTWRCMGNFDDEAVVSGLTIDGATLWLRIA